MPVAGAHVGTFAALDGQYAADSIHVYYERLPLTKDPQSFRVLKFGVPANPPADVPAK